MRKLILLFIVLPFFSCRTLNPSLMFQTGKNYPYAVDSLNKQATQYVIAQEDLIAMRIFTNEGFRLIDVTQGTNGTNGTGESIQYLVEPDGNVKLPLIGKLYLKGMNVQQAEKFLEEKYALYYNSPYVTLHVSNLHVLVFSGDGGTGKVVNLANENTTVVEALTLAGGILSRGKAYKIKIIRGDLKNPLVFYVDLSTM